MPKVSRKTASGHVSIDGLDVRTEELEGGYTVCFEQHTADADLAELFRGLPDDRAQLARCGYVIRGKITYRFADHDETYTAGDAYYVPPGHTPLLHAGCEIVEFSPTEQVREAVEVIMRNLEGARVVTPGGAR
ncbi:MAG TPA: hypothetical protein VH950_10365 [Gaiellaceae bacterium]|jgi:hypothetical protein